MPEPSLAEAAACWVAEFVDNITFSVRAHCWHADVVTTGWHSRVLLFAVNTLFPAQS